MDEVYFFGGGWDIGASRTVFILPVTDAASLEGVQRHSG